MAATGPDLVLIDQLQRSLHAAADPARAPAMQAYMKSALPFLGVGVPTVRKLTRDLERARPPADDAQLTATVDGLWASARYREERYAASSLLTTVTARRLAEPARLALLERLIRSGQWWDHTDELSHRVGELLGGYPEPVGHELRRWARAEDRWLRRSAVICQLGRGPATDLDLLVDAVTANHADPDFFLRKGIGWALRDYARTDPEWVRGFVRTTALSPLSAREALKHL